MTEQLMHTRVFRIPAAVRLTRDFLVTAQITPLDCWNYYANISATIHNSPHWCRGIV